MYGNTNLSRNHQISAFGLVEAIGNSIRVMCEKTRTFSVNKKIRERFNYIDNIFIFNLPKHGIRASAIVYTILFTQTWHIDGRAVSTLRTAPKGFTATDVLSSRFVI